MTSSIDSQFYESYVPVYDAIPEKWEDARPFVVEQLKKISNGVNARTIGFYLDQELLSGNAFFPSVTELSDGGTNQQFRSILRKVIDFGSLPNSMMKSVRHEISFTSSFSLIHIWGASTDPVNLIAIPIPQADPNVLANAIKLTMDSTYINITTGANYSTFTRTFVVIEYIQEN